MNNLLKSSTLGAALLTAMLPLACCWGPTLLASVAILSGGASQLAWLHPYEPYLYGISFITLGYSHFSAFKAKREEALDCDNCAADNATVINSRHFNQIALWLATIAVISMFILNQFPEWFIY